MSRKRSYSGGPAKKDFKYGNETVYMLVNKLMQDGKKTVAQNICYGALEQASSQLNCSPVEALGKAIENIKPLLEVKSRRVGGANYQVPVEVSQRRGVVLSIRWIVEISRASKGRSMKDRLASELLMAAKGEGAAVTKKETMHKMAEANKAFAHYRW